MLLKACLNGPRVPAEHPSLPTTAEELARDTAAVVAAGAGAVHLHVKDGAGQDTLAAEPLAVVLTAVRNAAPYVPLGVTTGAWAASSPRDRVTSVHSWHLLPDFASVNWHEAGADAVATALLECGVGVEAGLWHDDAVVAWTRSPVRDRCLRVLLELPDGLDATEAVQTADHMLDGVRRATGDAIPVLLHGEGSSCWPGLRHAAARGLAGRIGLEDTLTLPDGSIAPDNAGLVRAALELVRLGLDPGRR
jgi:uncharacterized protein (DUF849 family)